MKQAESQDRPHGDARQWYLIDPVRLRAEKETMELSFPNFSLVIDCLQNVTWEGVLHAELETELGIYLPDAKVNDLRIKIVCPADYPIAFPLVYDLENKFLTAGCDHVNKADGSVCYGLRPTTELDFENKHTVRDLIGVLQNFILKEDHRLRFGKHPDEELHGSDAVVLYEFDHGPLDSGYYCYCGKATPYRFCCLAQVQHRIAQINLRLRTIFGKRKLGPNSGCLCKSNKKYKKCCQQKGRTQFINLYPQLARDHLTALLKNS